MGERRIMAKKEFIMVDGIKCTAAAPLVDIDSIIPYERNAKIHGTELEFLKNAIKDPKIGFCDPIEVDRDWIIVSGHGRRQAALELGMKKVPCVRHEHLSGDASAAYRLIANRSGELSGYDFDIQKMEIDALEENGWDMQKFSFEDMSMFDGPEEEPQIEDEYVTEQDEPQIEYTGGDTYKLMVICHSPKERSEAAEAIAEMGYNVQTI